MNIQMILCTLFVRFSSCNWVIDVRIFDRPTLKHNKNHIYCNYANIENVVYTFMQNKKID